MSGWIALHRGWRDCEAFQDEPVLTERDAWVWLIEKAAWKPCVRRGPKGERVEIDRGQYHTSLRNLGKAWGWGKWKVQHYLERLEEHGMLRTVTGQSGSLLTVCNYAKYQDMAFRDQTVDRTVTGQSPDTQEQGKHSSASNEAGVPPTDIVKAIWDIGVSMLVASGHDERAARSIVGRWRKGRENADVLAAMLDCQAKGISNPVEWMPKRLQNAAPSPSAYASQVLEKYREAA